MSTPASVPRETHPWMMLLERYRAIWRAAWDVRHELTGPKRLADEAAFLPAALSLVETPVHPAPRRAALTICALFFLAVLWACLGELDVVATAAGRIVVSDGSKLLQPLEISVVKAIYVRDGDHVKAGQLLIDLDATLAEADRQRVLQERSAAISEALRTDALLLAMETSRAPQLAQDPELAKDDRLMAVAQLSSEWSDIQAKLARLRAEANRHQAEAKTVAQQIDKIETTLPMSRQREADIKTLSEQGFIAGHTGQDRTRERIELEKDLSTARARLQEADAARFESDQGYAAQRAEIIRTLRERHMQAQLKRQQSASEAVKASQKTRLMQLTAPVSGTVQQLAVHTSGGVVTPAQVLLVVVPDRADVTAEVMLENKDIGFVKEGQHAEVKLETFPFTRYGTVSADVISVAGDAVMQASAAKADGSTSTSAEQRAGQTAGFPATLRLAQRDINVDGRAVHLSPGMNLTVEIKTGRRKVIDYLLSPVREHLSDSLKER